MIRNRGFSILEVVVALALLTLLLFGLVATTASSVQLTELAQEKRLALGKADAVLNRLLADKNLPQTWSDAAGDPKPNTKFTTGTPTGTPAYPTDYVMDLATDLGETFPKELLLAEGSATIKAFKVNPTVEWTPARPFVWSEGHFYQITVTVRWLPGIERRTNAKKTFTAPTAAVKVESLYYRSPP